MPTETPEEKKKRLEEERKERESRAKTATPAPAAKSEPPALLKKPVSPAPEPPALLKKPDSADPLGLLNTGAKPVTPAPVAKEQPSVAMLGPTDSHGVGQDNINLALQAKTDLAGTQKALGDINAQIKAMEASSVGYPPSYIADLKTKANLLTKILDGQMRQSNEMAKATALAPKPEVAAMPKTITPQAAKAAEAIATAPPNRVEQVISKLKEEEAKGGPSLWDVIEAASAGWRGDVPLYVKKQLEEQAEKARMGQIETTAQLQAAIQAEEQAKMFERQRDLLREELASREKIAGLKGLEMDPLGSLTDEFLKGRF